MTVPKINFTISTRIANICTGLILALVPFHAFLTVWGASFGLSYTALRGWSAVVLAVLVGVVAFWLIRDKALRVWASQSFLVLLVIIIVILNLLLGLRGVLLGTVGVQALLLGLLLNLRYLVFFLAVVVLMKYSNWSRQRWLRIILTGAIIVSAFGVLQYTVLPHDFLAHFGYGTATIEPFETINNNLDYIRVASTLRGANPLGAYMLVIITLLVALRPWPQRKTAWSIVLALCLGALVFSFSRSAWLGTLVALVCVVILRLQTRRQWQRAGLASLGIVILMMAIFFVLRDNRFAQNALYHTDDNSTVAVSSNDQRSSALLAGARDVLHDPLGRGVGSAGPASVHNTAAPARLAENYYLQIGQELGWVGLLAYLALSFAVGFQLWQQRREAFALGLLAAFIGLIVVNMLSHAWTDDTLAFTWWGLAGIAIGQGLWSKKAKTH